MNGMDYTEITKRNVLLECLGMMEQRRNEMSAGQRGLVPAAGYEDEFFRQQEKCRVLQRLIQAYESEPVRKAVAEWQVRLMEGKRPTLDDLKEVRA